MRNILAIPTSRNVAEQCVEMGLQVGDVIRDFDPVRMELEILWIGKSTVVVNHRYRIDDTDDWADPVETTGWSLAYRKWELIK